MELLAIVIIILTIALIASPLAIWARVNRIDDRIKEVEQNTRRTKEILEIVFREHLDAENQRILEIEEAKRQAAEERRQQRAKEKEDTTLEDYEDWKKNR